MKRFRSSAVGVVLAVLALVGLIDVAAKAANGAALLLGSSNSESRTATVTNAGAGAALKLNARAGTPALGVSNTARIPLLNADMVDGLHASSFVAKSDKLVWTTLALGNGVAVSGSTAPAYAVRNDVVYLRGCLKVTGAISTDDAFTLPTSVLPARQGLRMTVTGFVPPTTFVAAAVLIYSHANNPANTVGIYQETGTDLSVCLDGSYTR